MKNGLDALLFNLLILGVVKSNSGEVWRRRLSDLYVIELTTGPKQGVNETVQRRLLPSKVNFTESLSYHQSGLRDTMGGREKKRRTDLCTAFFILLLDRFKVFLDDNLH